MLQQRIHVRPRPELLARVPVQFYVFDLLALDGEPVMTQPYQRRRELLAGLGLDGEHVRVPPNFAGIAPTTMLDLARTHGFEGIVTKKIQSRYRPGARSRDWIKTPLRTTTEVIVGGWTPGSGRRAGNCFGSGPTSSPGVADARLPVRRRCSPTCHHSDELGFMPGCDE